MIALTADISYRAPRHTRRNPAEDRRTARRNTQRLEPHPLQQPVRATGRSRRVGQGHDRERGGRRRATCWRGRGAPGAAHALRRARAPAIGELRRFPRPGRDRHTEATRQRRERQSMAAQLTLQDVSLQFGGIKVLQDVELRRRAGADLRARRSQRRGQDLALQLHQRALQADLGHRRGSTAPRSRARARPRSPGTGWPARSSIRPCSCTRPCSRTCCSVRTPDSPAAPCEWALRLPRTRRSEKELRAEALDLLERNGLGWAAAPAGRRAVARPAQGRRALPRAAHRSRGCCSSTSPPPASRTPRWSS